jgi:heparan-alpha-glucosaminide N-acetyltransferase
MIPAASAKPAKAPAPAAIGSDRAQRVLSIDALRGIVMFTMIYVNDLAGAGKIVPDWMMHFSERHGRGSGMTFVDLVFPGFLFIVGLSIPFALGARIKKGEATWRILLHIMARTASLLAIGILMVNETPDSAQMGWSGELWCTLMYISAILAFCVIEPGKPGSVDLARRFRYVTLGLRVLGIVSLIWLALAFRGKNGQQIISLSPFSIHREWYGILGLIGWSYLVGSVVFLVFRGNRTALLACVALLLCLYPADRKHAFDNFWLTNYIGIGEMLGAHPSITVAGLLLGSILIAPDTTTVASRVRFALLFAAGFAAAALLLNGLYGISKNSATPSWCLWSCAITAMVWLLLYFVTDVRRVGFIANPLATAGQNVLLAYLISEMLPSALDVVHLGDWYDGLTRPTLWHAVSRSVGCAIAVLCATAGLNRLGFRLKL